MATLGIDVAKESLEVTLLKADGQQAKGQFANSQRSQTLARLPIPIQSKKPYFSRSSSKLAQ